MTTSADVVRDYLIQVALPDYLPAVLFDESLPPFTLRDRNILYVRQEGRPIESFTRQHDVQVWLYTKDSGNLADAEQVRNDAELAAQTLFENPRFNRAYGVSILIEDINGPYHTSTNRFFYRFAFRVLSEFNTQE